ncbi:hypothetical protein TeGR_g11985 [Tetraparma gracilis]|uniref:Uncharacterized protein n=1 Tax=Tetraparma gracilis TaxID=2962635 RepID=A0ABQ6NAK2_9STRA|nr:hypothetical protein TeGR_g11985 [Tetraparma gracilis]
MSLIIAHSSYIDSDNAPFIFVQGDDPEWTCSNPTSELLLPMSVTCTAYEECPGGSYGAAGGVCQECPADTPFSDPGTVDVAGCVRPPETCAEVDLVGCLGTLYQDDVSLGSFVPFTGDCPGARAGTSTWFNELTQMFMYYPTAYDYWMIGKACDAVTSSAFGAAGSAPWINTAAQWRCPDDAGVQILMPASVECIRYDDECPADHYEQDSECVPCPLRRSKSFIGTATSDGCFSTEGSLYGLSKLTARLTAYNHDESSHELLKEGGELTGISFALTFVSPTELFVINHGSVDEVGALIKTDTEGEVLALTPMDYLLGVLFLPDRGQILVTKTNEFKFFLIDVDSLDESYTLDSAAYFLSPTGSGLILGLMSRGETDDEFLAVSASGTTVWRVCLPESSCKPAVREVLMLTGVDIVDIDVIKSKNTYLVVDRSDDNVLECDLTTPNAHASSCTVFAFWPE